jgi:membrane associated rhomboid family serine protease
LRSFEIIAALILAAGLFIILKVIGMVVKFAAIAAVIGFVAGLLLARAFRR